MRTIVFHSIRMGDVEDPELYAAQPIWEWQQTDQGKWVMKNCSDPKFNVNSDPATFGFRIDLYGEIEDIKATEFYLKWQKQS